AEVLRPHGGEARPRQGRRGGRPIACALGEREPPLSLGPALVEVAEEERVGRSRLMDGHAGGGGQGVPESIGDGQRLIVQCQRVTQGERRRRFLAGSQQVVERASPVFREREMMREYLVVLGEPVGVELFDGAADQTVQLATALYEQ